MLKKSSISEPAVVKETSYPCLKKYVLFGEYILVLFSSKRTGVCVYDIDRINNSVGKSSNDWNEDSFIYFDGKLVLENGDD